MSNSTNAQVADSQVAEDHIFGRNGIELFQGLSSAQQRTLQSLTRYKTFATGHDLLTWGERSGMVYVLVQGSVKVYVRRSDEDEVLFALLGRGEVVGDLSAIDRLPHSASVRALEKTGCLAMTAASFVSCLESIPCLNINTMSLITRRLRRVYEQAEVLATLDVNGRIAYHLVNFAQHHGRIRSLSSDNAQTSASGSRQGSQGRVVAQDIVIPLRLTQSDLALLVGASREWVNKSLCYYKRQGYISFSSPGCITVHNLPALMSHCRHVASPKSHLAPSVSVQTQRQVA
ncbi:MAG TPA: Crp/Fnr family transcriptional regulator [Abditibacteriaceae bacterium]|jgi:CRP-like cAMP-binding protein